MPDLTDGIWRKSSRSNNGGECFEVADDLSDIVGLCDSKDPTDPMLTVSPSAWSTFAASVRSQTLSN